MKKCIVGIDEVGRGPFAGPVTVCACSIPNDFDRKLFKGFRDSKRLSANQRGEWFQKIKSWQKIGLKFGVTSVSNKVIDSKGLSVAINSALLLSLAKIKSPNSSVILLDGGLKAPKEFKNQKTIVKGDEKEPIIALASIIAKVTRDAYMIRIAKKYPQYNLEINKGYGTKAHSNAILKYGLSPIHRKSFTRRHLATLDINKN